MTHTARDIMTKTLISVEKTTSINELNRLFVEHNISSAPVVNDENKLVGIVTKTDVLSHLMDKDINLSLNDVLHDVLYLDTVQDDTAISPEKVITVQDIMTPDPITFTEDATVTDMAKNMIAHNIHRLIINRGDEILGIVSTLDILYHVAGIDKNE